MTALPADISAHPDTRMGGLALALQEAFTVGARLRAGRQHAADAASFRGHVRTLLSAADGDARGRGYDPNYVKLAIYAYAAFLDETVLNSAQAMFAEWTRQPLQEEIFGEHMAGENFFRYLNDLLGRPDSPDLADLLEVYLLCLQLGFRGRYMNDPGSLHGLTLSLQQKIHRIRGESSTISATWMLPQNERAEIAADPWFRRLLLALAVSVAVTVVVWVLFTLVLRGSASEIDELTRQLTARG
ncbi:MAG: type IVB secretion system protein IcmH/DotU [Longimicrobiales bacterium]